MTVPTALPLPTDRPDLRDFLKTRRSNLAKLMSGPGPTTEQRDELLKIAARVPDHRKLAPWRFIVFEGDARAEFGQHLGTVFQRKNPDMPLDRAMFEAARLQRAPLVVAVISSPKDCPRGTPKWEQELSSGAVCFNLCLAAQSMGFGAQWLTEWYAFDSDIDAVLGLSEGERVSGYIYIGTVETPSSERPRPTLADITQFWSSS